MARTSDLLRVLALPLALAVLTVSCASGGAGERYETSVPGCIHPSPDGVISPVPLIFPANHATGVPINIGTIYFGAAPNGPATALLLAPATLITSGTLVAAPSPLPSGVPNNGGPVWQASISVMLPATTYTVQVDEPSVNPCSSWISGSFTTQ